MSIPEGSAEIFVNIPETDTLNTPSRQALYPDSLYLIDLATLQNQDASIRECPHSPLSFTHGLGPFILSGLIRERFTNGANHKNPERHKPTQKNLCFYGATIIDSLVECKKYIEQRGGHWFTPRPYGALQESITITLFRALGIEVQMTTPHQDKQGVDFIINKNGDIFLIDTTTGTNADTVEIKNEKENCDHISLLFIPTNSASKSQKLFDLLVLNTEQYSLSIEDLIQGITTLPEYYSELYKHLLIEAMSELITSNLKLKNSITSPSRKKNTENVLEMLKTYMFRNYNTRI